LKVTSKINRSNLDESQIARLEEIENEMQTHIQLKEEEMKELKFSKDQIEEELDELKR
jgi:hypothetical protein